MDLHGYDEIRMIDAPSPVPDIMKHVIAKHWRHGLKQDSEPVKRHGHEWHVMVSAISSVEAVVGVTADRY